LTYAPVITVRTNMAALLGSSERRLYKQDNQQSQQRHVNDIHHGMGLQVHFIDQFLGSSEHFVNSTLTEEPRDDKIPSRPQQNQHATEGLLQACTDPFS
jgi:hypothetical protein